jgi:diguanylate cyclase
MLIVVSVGGGSLLTKSRSESVPDWFEASASPLLDLVQHLTGLETAFITAIDWNSFRQSVILSNYDETVPVAAGGHLDWSDSMCRHMFTRGKEQSNEIDIILPDSVGCSLGMKTFFVIPIEQEDNTIGTLCGASAERTVLSDDQMQSMRLIADALSSQLIAWSEVERSREESEKAKRSLDHLESQVKVLKREAETDPLTGLLNRRGFARRWQSVLDLAPDEDHRLGVMILDVDFFKPINDTYGHEFGDLVLKGLADVIVTQGDDTWFSCRAGGDEFIVAVTGVDTDRLYSLAAMLGDSFTSHPLFVERGLTNATLSIGIATTEKLRPDELLRSADEALYDSKNNGRNRVTVA